MNYGLPYVGSKNKIAKTIIDFLPPADHFYDLFAGGCAITHAAILSNKYKIFHVNDINIQYPSYFADIISGKRKVSYSIYNRNDFHNSKNDNVECATCWSFGNNLHSFLWGKDIEELKILVCKMLLSENLHERYTFYQKFIKHISTNNFKNRDLNQIESIERILRISDLEKRNVNIEITGLDYRDVKIEQNSVVYCDPPYKNVSNCYNVKFNHDQFYTYLRTVPFPVYVSEYNMPDDFIEILKINKTCFLSNKNNKKTQEKLFIHERFLNNNILH